MLDELLGHLRVGGAGAGQLHRDLEHVLAEEGHPGRAVGLLEEAPHRQRRAAIEHPDVVHAEEPALEHVAAGAVLAIHPPGEVQQQLLERALEPVEVLVAMGGRQAVRVDGRPGVDRRVDVAEVPLVGGQLAVGVEVRRAEHQVELPLAELFVAPARETRGPTRRTRGTPTCPASR